MKTKVCSIIVLIVMVTLVACTPQTAIEDKAKEIITTVDETSESAVTGISLTDADKERAKEVIKALGSSGSEFGDIAIYGIRKALESAGAVKTEIDEFITGYETDDFVAYETKFEDEDSAYSYYISTYEAIPDKCEVLTDKDKDGFDSYVVDNEDADTLYIYLFPYVVTVTGDKTFIESLLN
jgi:hypothetical protein